ncbi:MAG: sigma-70 family RNA polymerase sigma factor, partial [Mariprofundaceae bacterium]|nr:sigma-70 family RNA polymerase sigma factor [Mariprofundaceae bacterium]
WLVGILKHKITDYVRKQIRDRNLANHLETDPTSDFFNANGQWQQPVHGWTDNPEQLSSNQEFLRTLHACIAKLPEQHRHVFSLRELMGEDTEDICKACDITPTNLHVIMHRARLALRQCLEKTWFGNE